MTLTMNKATTRATTTAAALNNYYAEITVTDAEIDMVMAEIEAKEMAMAEAMDAALAAFFEQEVEYLMKTSGLS